MKAMASVATPVDEPIRPGFFPGAARRTEAAPTSEPPKQESGDLEPSVYRFILKHSLRQQIFLLLLTLASFPFLYYSLDLPKTIVNRAIDGKRFPQELLGIEFGQIPYLMVLCAIFLALVFINGGFKY